MKRKNTLNARGNATIVATPVMFGVAEALFHAHPIVGGAVGILSGYITYKHFDDVMAKSETIKSQVVHGYQRTEGDHHPVNSSRPSASQPAGRPDTDDDNDRGILLGTEKKRNREIRKILKDLQGVLILGLPGQGKSTTACNVVSQLVEDYGAKIILVDRHARSKESLTAMLSPWQSAFLKAPAREYSDMVDSFDLAEQILDERTSADEAPFPVLLVVDEMTSLLQKEGQSGDKGTAAKKCAEVVESWNEEGRKYHCFCICIGQLTNASRTGGTEVRQLFSSFFVHGMAESQARLILSKEHAIMANRLGRGECVLLNTNSKEEPFVIKVPGLKKKPVPIKSDIYDEIAEMEDINTGELDQELVEKALTNAPINPRLVEIGRDNRTKEPVEIPEETFNLFLNAANAGNPMSIKAIQSLLGCSEQHAKNVASMVKEQSRDCVSE